MDVNVLACTILTFNQRFLKTGEIMFEKKRKQSFTETAKDICRYNLMRFFLAFFLFFTFSFCIFTQENELENSFSFDEEKSSDEKKFTVNIGGEAYTGLSFYFLDFQNLSEVVPSLPFWGNIKLEAKSPIAEAYMGFKLSDKTIPQIALGEKSPIKPERFIPSWIDEAYIQVSAGHTVLGGGIKKTTWGRANTMSVLDIINPHDYSDLTELNLNKTKIAQPMFFLVAYLPLDMKLDFIYLPIFEPNKIALSGRWQNNDLKKIDEIKNEKTNTLSYSQGGLRYTASIAGNHDIGIQYFCGILHQPIITKSSKQIIFSYNRYHHIGIDYSTLFGPLIIHAEFAANITNDLSGNKPDVYNPNLAWNIGLDYSLPYNLNLNLVAAETIKLNTQNINKENSSDDIEKGSKITDTHIMLAISQKLVRGAFEWKVASTFGLEDLDFMIVPSANLLLGSTVIDVGFGFFGGMKTGKFGRYINNHFIKFSVGYIF